MELDGFVTALQTAGPVGFWAAVGIALFRYLLTRHDSLARQNLAELQRQLSTWRRRALRSEMLVRAYHAGGAELPTKQVQREVLLQRELEGINVWPEYGIDGELTEE